MTDEKRLVAAERRLVEQRNVIEARVIIEAIVEAIDIALPSMTGWNRDEVEQVRAELIDAFAEMNARYREGASNGKDT